MRDSSHYSLYYKIFHNTKKKKKVNWAMALGTELEAERGPRACIPLPWTPFLGHSHVKL